MSKKNTDKSIINVLTLFLDIICIIIFNHKEPIEKTDKTCKINVLENPITKIDESTKLGKPLKIDKKALTLAKRIEKYKHFDDMTDEEVKKFNQAKNYYIRKSKTSTILPKDLNKNNPDVLTAVCKKLAQNGFHIMSEALFIKVYKI